MVTPIPHSATLSPASSGDDDDEILETVPARDNHTCQVCGGLCAPVGELSWVATPHGRSDEHTPEAYLLLCVRCYHRSRQETDLSEELTAASWWYESEADSWGALRLLVRNGWQRFRQHWYTGRGVVAIRTIGVLVGLLGLVVGFALLGGIAGMLFVGPQAGLTWATSVLTIGPRAITTIHAHPSLLVGVLGLGYGVHVIERERYYAATTLWQDQTFGKYTPPEETASIALTTLVTGATSLAVLGGVYWTLTLTGVFVNPVGATVFWFGGAVGLGYSLPQLTQSDGYALDLPIRPARWRATIHVSLLIGALAIGSVMLPRFLPPAWLSRPVLGTSVEFVSRLVPVPLAIGCLWGAGLVGSAYLGRRYAARHLPRVASAIHLGSQPRAVFLLLFVDPTIVQQSRGIHRTMTDTRQSPDGTPMSEASETADRKPGASPQFEAGAGVTVDAAAGFTNYCPLIRLPPRLQQLLIRIMRPTAAVVGPGEDGSPLLPPAQRRLDARFDGAVKEIAYRDQFTCQLCWRYAGPETGYRIAPLAVDPTHETISPSTAVTFCETCVDEHPSIELRHYARFALTWIYTPAGDVVPVVDREQARAHSTHTSSQAGHQSGSQPWWEEYR
jgi:hypothetical protein